MTRRTLMHCLGWLVLASPLAAQALELDYYTYNSFEETVAAFQRVALVLADPGFLVFATVFAILGVLIGGFVTAAKGIQGHQINPIAFLIPAAIGVALFRGLVIPTGTLFIYDPVRNANQAVGDVPDIIVFLAGGLNKIERGIVDIVDTASAKLYSEDGGATDFSLVLNAWDVGVPRVNLQRTLVNYYTDCGLPSMALGTNGATTEELKHNSTDLLNTFAKWNSAGLATVYYPNADDTSVTGTCADAWSYLNPILTTPGTFADAMGTTCKQSGFDRTSPAQMTRCEQELTSATQLYGVAASNSLPFMRSLVMARSVSDALNSDDFNLQQRQIVDRQIMAEGLGAAAAMNRWVPKLRGFLVATVLGIVPLALLFVVTPFVGRAFALVGGLFLWVSLWGITDAISVQMARDSAIEAFEQIRAYGLSYDAFMNTPEAAVQALGVFGKARSGALMLATVLSYGLFRFGGYAFTSIAQNWQAHLDQAGESAGRTVMLPENRGAFAQQLISSVGPQATLVDSGFSAAAFSSAQAQMRGAMEARYITERLQGSTSASGTAAAAMNYPRTTPQSIDYGSMMPGAGAITASVSASNVEAATAGIGAVSTTATPISNAPLSAPAEDASDPMQEVRVQGTRPVGRIHHSLDSPYQLLDVEAQESAGKQIGRAQSYIEAADARAQSVFDTSQQASQYLTTMELESTFGRREQHKRMPGGVAQAGQLEGQMAGARSLAFMEIYQNLNGGSEELTPEGMLNMARQLEGAAIAISKIPGVPDDYIRSVEQSQRVSMAYARELERTGKADTLGESRAQQEIVRGVGFLQALHSAGYLDMVHGAAFSDLLNAARGRAAYETHEPLATARHIEQSSLAAQIGRDAMTRDVAAFLGLDNHSIQGLIQAEGYRQGAHLSLAIPAERSAEILKKLAASGRFAPENIDYMSRQGGFALNFDMAEGGAIAATVIAGSRTLVSHTFEVDYSQRLAGDLAVMSHLDDELLRAYRGDLSQSQHDKVWFWRVAAALGDSLTARGVQLRASSDESLSYLVQGGGHGQIGTPAESIVGDGLSASGQVGVQRTDADTASTNADINIVAAARILEEERTSAVTHYETQHGIGSARSADQGELAKQVAESVETRLRGFYNLSRMEVNDAVERNDVYEDFFKVPGAVAARPSATPPPEEKPHGH